MTLFDVLQRSGSRTTSSLGLAACAAVLVLATACGPLGDDDEDDPTAVATQAATPAASPVTSPAPATPARSTPVPLATEAVEDDGTPRIASPTRTPTSEASSADEEDSGAVLTPTPPVAEGCGEPEDLPDLQGPSGRVISDEADEGVNLRAGPGADCDILATLLPGTAVEVQSGPVRSGDFDWVKITVEGTAGWIAEEFLDPIEDAGT